MRTIVGMMVAALWLTGCPAAMPVSSTFRLPDESRTACYSVCGQMGMQVGAVVVISNSVGCVCEPTAGGPSASVGGGAAAAGGAAIIAAEAAAQQRQQSTTTSYTSSSR